MVKPKDFIYTNYLGELVKNSPEVTLQHTGQYEAVLTFCAYISRLNYESNINKILHAFKFLQYSPIVFNTCLRYLTYTKLEDKKITEFSNSNAETPISGYFIYDQPDDLPLSVTLFDYSNPGSSKIFPGEKVLVIGFRGTLSLKTVLKDLNMKTKPLSELGTHFTKLPSVGSGVGKAHGGFINGIKNVFEDIFNIVIKILEKNKDVSRLIITGHSLGGGYANICGLGFANMKKKTELLKTLPIHVITFGGPKTFSQSGRDIFNEFLKDGTLTLDRVINAPVTPDPLFFTTNVIATIPNNLYHPGFSLTMEELYTPGKTGRFRYIANTRKNAGLHNTRAWYSLSKIVRSNYNPLPYYEEFFKMFKDSELVPEFTSEDYGVLINSSPNGSVYPFSLVNKKESKRAIEVVKIAMNLDDAAVKQASTAVKEAEMSSVKNLEDNTGTKGLSTSGLPQPIAEAEAENPSNPRKTRKSNRKGGNLQIGGLFDDKYSEETKGLNPNVIVYSCSALTTPVPVPFVMCHLGYMGVGWLGVSAAVGAAVAAALNPWKVRLFDRYVVILKKPNGGFEYVSDKQGVNVKPFNIGTGNFLKPSEAPSNALRNMAHLIKQPNNGTVYNGPVDDPVNPSAPRRNGRKTRKSRR